MWQILISVRTERTSSEAIRSTDGCRHGLWPRSGMLTQEHFLEHFADKGHFVAFRGSYGIQGNIHDDATPNLILSVGNRHDVSNLEQSTIYRLPNPDLRWEKTASWNAAVDFSFWNGRLSGSFDVYKKYTKDCSWMKTVHLKTDGVCFTE